MKLESMRHFITLARAGSFYQAAKQSSISVQGYSKVLASLESELGVALAVRDRTGVRLTRAGEVFLSYAQEAVAGLDDTVERLLSLDECQARPAKRLRMYLTHYGMHIVSWLDYLSETLIGFDLCEEPFERILLRLENPGEDDTFCTEILSANTLPRLDKLGIAYEPFYRSVLGVVVRDDSPAARNRQISKAGIAALDLAHYPHREWSVKTREVFGGKLPENIRFETTGAGMLLDYARTDRTRGCIADSFAFFSLEKYALADTDGLVFVALDDTSALFSGGMLHSKKHTPSLRAQAVIDRYRHFSQTKIPDYYQAYPMLL